MKQPHHGWLILVWVRCCFRFSETAEAQQSLDMPPIWLGGRFYRYLCVIKWCERRRTGQFAVDDRHFVVTQKVLAHRKHIAIGGQPLQTCLSGAAKKVVFYSAARPKLNHQDRTTLWTAER
jgi:hypothetical protein